MNYIATISFQCLSLLRKVSPAILLHMPPLPQSLRRPPLILAFSFGDLREKIEGIGRARALGTQRVTFCWRQRDQKCMQHNHELSWDNLNTCHPTTSYWSLCHLVLVLNDLWYWRKIKVCKTGPCALESSVFPHRELQLQLRLRLASVGQGYAHTSAGAGAPLKSAVRRVPAKEERARVLRSDFHA